MAIKLYYLPDGWYMEIIDGDMSIISPQEISREYAKLLFSRKNWKCFSKKDWKFPTGPLKIRGFISLT
jgi:hypothetical protein